MSTPSWPSLYNPGLELIDIEHTAPTQPGGSYLHQPIDVFRFTLYWTFIFYCPIFLLCGLFAFWNFSFPPAPRPYNINNNNIRPGRNSSGTNRHTPEPHERVANYTHLRKRSRTGGLWSSSPTSESYYPLASLTSQMKPEPPPPPVPMHITHPMPSTSTSFPTTTSFPASYRSTTPLVRASSPFTSQLVSSSPRQSSDAQAQAHSQLAQASPTPSAAPNKRKQPHELRSRFTFAFLVLLIFIAASLAGAVISSAILGFIVAAFFRSVDYNMSTWIPFLLAFISVFVGYLSLWSSVIDII